jgi:hypothetical protein
MGQHRVTEFYLRGFSQRHGPRVLFEYSKSEGFAKEIKPKFASAASRIFAVEGPDENAAENFLGLVETRAKPVFQKLRNQVALEPDDQAALSQFIALSYVRSPRICEHFEQIRSLYTPEEIFTWLESPAGRIAWLLRNPTKHSRDYDGHLADYKRSVLNGVAPLPSKPAVNSQFRLLQHQGNWIAMLLRMSWCIEVACEGAFFLVGDEPLCARRPHQPFDPKYVPIASRDVEVSFPVNRRICLTARWAPEPKEPMRYIPVEQDRVDDLNVRTVVCAHRLFWSRERNARCDAYVGKVGGRSIVVTSPKTLEEFLNEPAKV